nr:FAD-dependent 5-carboxymethylaminomethyl-2-thiouridine(34) oxidoreductase MnmC [Roseateles koreensis]
MTGQLLEAWPPLTPNLHRLSFESSQVQLLLCLGDVHAWLRELVAEVDTFHLNPPAPDEADTVWDAHAFKALARRAAPGATLTIGADASPAALMHAGLSAGGFTLDAEHNLASDSALCTARHKPRHHAQKPAGRQALAPAAKTALIIGGGLAGSACAWALAQHGIQSQVIDAKAGPAQSASGNPGGLFHGTLNPDDGLHARFNRAAALETQRVLRSLAPLPWLQQGLLRLESNRDLAQMQSLIERLGLPPDYVQALSAAQASAQCGLTLQQPAWLYPGGGALPPSGYVRALLEAAKADTLFNADIAQISRDGDHWQAWDAQGERLGQAPLLVLAGGLEGHALLQAQAVNLSPMLLRLRGQLSHLTPAAIRPALPVAGLGYAIADREQGLWCGATNDAEPLSQPLDASLRPEDHAHNLAQWWALSGQRNADAPANPPMHGRVGWRLATPDRLPLVGGLPLPAYDGRRDQARFIPRQAGLAVCTALGSRGIAWAALCGQVLAAQVTGAPCPIESSLLDAIDPARFAVVRSDAR